MPIAVSRFWTVVPLAAALRGTPLGARPLPHTPVSASCPAAAAVRSRAGGATTLLREAFQAMGGRQRLCEVHALRLAGVEVGTVMQAQLHPRGPYRRMLSLVDELRDVDGTRSRSTATMRMGMRPVPLRVTWTVTPDAGTFRVGEVAHPGLPWDIEARREALALAPERLLFTAERAHVRVAPDAILRGRRCHVLAFELGAAAVRVLLDAETHLPDAVEVTRDYRSDAPFGAWGDVTLRTEYSAWALERGGLRYPLQRDQYWGRHAIERLTITSLEVNPAAPPDSFAIPAALRNAYVAAESAGDGERDSTAAAGPDSLIAPGVVMVGGSFRAYVIRQSDGLVVFEAPQSAAKSRLVMRVASERFPGARLKALVVTSPEWVHEAGARAYAARGVRIYTLDADAAQLRAILAAPHRLHPDALARRGTTTSVIAVSRPLTLGAGPNRVLLIPARTPEAADVLIAYLPAPHLLYASDLNQPAAWEPNFLPEYRTEIAEIAAREHFVVDRVLTIHVDPVTLASLKPEPASPAMRR